MRLHRYFTFDHIMLTCVVLFSCRPSPAVSDEESNSERDMRKVARLLDEQLRYLKIFSLSFTAYENDVHVALEWRRVAMVLDRLFLYIVAMVTISVTSIILLYRPLYADELSEQEINDIIQNYHEA